MLTTLCSRSSCFCQRDGSSGCVVSIICFPFARSMYIHLRLHSIQQGDEQGGVPSSSSGLHFRFFCITGKGSNLIENPCTWTLKRHPRVRYTEQWDKRCYWQYLVVLFILFQLIHIFKTIKKHQFILVFKTLKNTLKHQFTLIFKTLKNTLKTPVHISI
jgi:hypothetical protein